MLPASGASGHQLSGACSEVIISELGSVSSSLRTPALQRGKEVLSRPRPPCPAPPEVLSSEVGGQGGAPPAAFRQLGHPCEPSSACQFSLNMQPSPGHADNKGSCRGPCLPFAGPSQAFPPFLGQQATVTQLVSVRASVWIRSVWLQSHDLDHHDCPWKTPHKMKSSKRAAGGKEEKDGPVGRAASKRRR